MLKVIMLAVAALTLPTVGLAQDTASLGPSASVNDIPGVVRDCQLVAGSEDDSSLQGVCIGATQSYLDSLDGQDVATVDQNITDLVVALVPLAQEDEACNALDDEVAQAIRLASARVSDAEQIARLVEIADTVAACDLGSTAAIEEVPPVGDPASPA
jgi:hypothetical protein